MDSAGYPEVGDWPEVAPRKAHAEWFRPGAYQMGQMKKKNPGLHRHVLSGGLIMRVPKRKFDSIDGPLLPKGWSGDIITHGESLPRGPKINNEDEDDGN